MTAQFSHAIVWCRDYFDDPDGHLCELIAKPYGKEEDL